MLQRGRTQRAGSSTWIIFTTLICLFLLAAPLDAAPKRNVKKKTAPPPLNLPPLKTQEQKMQLLGYIRQTMPTHRIGSRISFSSADLDKAFEQELGEGARVLADSIDDETFLRRVSLDLTGNLPAPEKIKAFISDQDKNKRSALIDELLETEAYARKWARYWTRSFLR